MERFCSILQHSIPNHCGGPTMYKNLEASLARAEKLLLELRMEYNKCFSAKTVTAEAAQLTHDICEKLRSVLDRVARRYFEVRVAQDLPVEERSRAKVYFPILDNQHSFDSELGRWRWKSVREKHQHVYDYLLDLQPFMNQKNNWLAILNDVAVAGKHIDLIPQKRLEEHRVNVSRAGAGRVSWGPGVTFGGGVSIMGAPIDPGTQRIVPTEGVTETVETWVSFVIEGYGVNAFGFCQEACKLVRHIVTEMSDSFGL